MTVTKNLKYQIYFIKSPNGTSTSNAETIDSLEGQCVFSHMTDLTSLSLKGKNNKVGTLPQQKKLESQDEKAVIIIPSLHSTSSLGVIQLQQIPWETNLESVIP
jgi:hypothetical protein